MTGLDSVCGSDKLLGSPRIGQPTAAKPTTPRSAVSGGTAGRGIAWSTGFFDKWISGKSHAMCDTEKIELLRSCVLGVGRVKTRSTSSMQ